MKNKKTLLTVLNIIITYVIIFALYDMSYISVIGGLVLLTTLLRVTYSLTDDNILNIIDPILAVLVSIVLINGGFIILGYTMFITVILSNITNMSNIKVLILILLFIILTIIDIVYVSNIFLLPDIAISTIYTLFSILMYKNKYEPFTTMLPFGYLANIVGFISLSLIFVSMKLMDSLAIVVYTVSMILASIGCIFVNKSR